MTPDVSVVIATRDRRSLLRLTLRSVGWQRDVDLEVIVVDDGSVDGTAEELGRSPDPRLRVIRHDRPRGVSAARNAGAEAARGRWIAFLDDDDLWAPTKLVCQLTSAERDLRTWAVSGAVVVDDTLEALAGEPPLSPERVVSDLERYNSVPVGASNVVVQRDVWRRTGAFDPSLRHMSDWDVWIRLAKSGPPATVAQPHVAYRVHRGAATVSTALDAAEPIRELDVITARYGIPADRAAVYRWMGWAALRAGSRRAAVRAYAHAVRHGDIASVGRLGLAVVYRGLGRRTFFSPLARTGQDRAWLDEAQTWLSALARG